MTNDEAKTLLDEIAANLRFLVEKHSEQTVGNPADVVLAKVLRQIKGVVPEDVYDESVVHKLEFGGNPVRCGDLLLIVATWRAALGADQLVFA